MGTDIQKHNLTHTALVAALGLLLALTACAREQHWGKPGLNQADFDRDLARCNREAESATHLAGYGPGAGLDQGLERSMARETVKKKCMATKGYTLEEK